MGTAYRRVKDALQRLRMTSIETTIRPQSGKRTRNRIRQFSWISEWEITEEAGEVRGVEVVLAEWLFESIQDLHVLTLDKRYFDIPGGVERWLYLYARKATGGPEGMWKETFKSLYKKSASQQDYKHYASSLRKLAQKNELPGLRLERASSSKGEDMLIMARTEFRPPIEANTGPQEQLELIELSPLEEAWESALEILRKRLGAATANSWVGLLNLVGLECGTLTFRAPTKFIADRVNSQYSHSLISAWESLGYEVAEIVIETAARKTGASPVQQAKSGIASR